MIDPDRSRAGGSLLEPFVIDCCVTMSWCFADEFNAETAAILGRLDGAEVFVPSHWHLEMAHVLLKGERRGRITRSEADAFLSMIRSLPIMVDDEPMIDTFPRVLALARAHGLSSYDAAYLECATRRGLPLATLDAKLKAAALAIGVRIFEIPADYAGGGELSGPGGTP